MIKDIVLIIYMLMWWNKEWWIRLDGNRVKLR